MPVAAWIINECLLCWSSRWGSAEAEAVGLTLKDSILSNTEHETLNYQCYWLCTTLAIGGIMRVTPPPLPPRRKITFITEFRPSRYQSAAEGSAIEKQQRGLTACYDVRTSKVGLRC
jgi:hypothetical protein